MCHDQWRNWCDSALRVVHHSWGFLTEVQNVIHPFNYSLQDIFIRYCHIISDIWLLLIDWWQSKWGELHAFNLKGISQAVSDIWLLLIDWWQSKWGELHAFNLKGISQAALSRENAIYIKDLRRSLIHIQFPWLWRNPLSWRSHFWICSQHSLSYFQSRNDKTIYFYIPEGCWSLETWIQHADYV